MERDSGISSHDWHVRYAYGRYLNENWFVQGNIEQKNDSDTPLWQQTTLMQGIKIGLTDHLVWNLFHLFECDKNDGDGPIGMQLKVGLGYK